MTVLVSFGVSERAHGSNMPPRYTRSEQPLRMCIFLAFNGMATMIGALLGFGLGHSTSTSLKSWQLIFLTIGLINFVWSIIFLWIMPDSPANAKFLTHRQRVVAVYRVSNNMIGVKTKQYKLTQVTEAFTDVKVLLIALIGVATGVINGGIANFASALIRGYVSLSEVFSLWVEKRPTLTNLPQIWIQRH